MQVPVLHKLLVPAHLRLLEVEEQQGWWAWEEVEGRPEQLVRFERLVPDGGPRARQNRRLDDRAQDLGDVEEGRGAPLGQLPGNPLLRFLGNRLVGLGDLVSFLLRPSGAVSVNKSFCYKIFVLQNN